mgnify:CR=1 FL=1
MKQLNEDNFTELFKFNPESAFRRFFDRYYFPLCAYAIQIVDDFAESEDIVQSFFVDFWEKQRYKYITGSFYSYALKSVYHQALKARNHPTENLETFLLDHIGPVVEEDMDEKDLQAKEKELYQALEKLSPKELQALETVFLEGKNYHAAADELGISTNTLKTYLTRALKKLRQINSLAIFILLYVNLCKK